MIVEYLTQHGEWQRDNTNESENTMTFGYDPEAVYQDADIEMLELADQADTTDDPCDNPNYLNRWDGDDLCMNCGFRDKWHLTGETP